MPAPSVVLGMTLNFQRVPGTYPMKPGQFLPPPWCVAKHHGWRQFSLDSTQRTRLSAKFRFAGTFTSGGWRAADQCCLFFGRCSGVDGHATI